MQDLAEAVADDAEGWESLADNLDSGLKATRSGQLSDCPFPSCGDFACQCSQCFSLHLLQMRGDVSCMLI